MSIPDIHRARRIVGALVAMSALLSACSASYEEQIAACHDAFRKYFKWEPEFKSAEFTRITDGYGKISGTVLVFNGFGAARRHTYSCNIFDDKAIPDEFDGENFYSQLLK